MDVEASLAERLDDEQYRDDHLAAALHLLSSGAARRPSRSRSRCALFPDSPVKQIARAFLVSEAAMEQRITRAKQSIAAAHVPFETPDVRERAERARPSRL